MRPVYPSAADRAARARISRGGEGAVEPREADLELYLVQHGVAKSEAEDPQRPLTAAGAEEVRRVASAAAQCGLRIDEIRHSGKRRAQQTAAILAEHLAPVRGTVTAEGLQPGDDVRPVGRDLANEAGSVMIVGHLPFLARLAGLLLVGDLENPVVRFRNGGLVCLRREGGKWALAWALTPDLVTPTA